MDKKNGQFGYQPGGIEKRGYQPTKPGNGYQPTTSGPSQPSTPPSGGSAVQDKNK
ncbi:MAG: hypothetical protein ACLTF6_00870 [Clostridium sp.]|mgnify:FL=1